MKKTLLITLFVTAIIFSIIPSCRKGSEDPIISLRSRAARLEGEWKADSYSSREIQTYIDNNGDSSSVILVFEGNTVYITAGFFPIYGQVTTNKIKFTKEGSWSSEKQYYASTDLFGTIIKINYYIQSSGEWEFNKATHGYKNKESITLHKLNETIIAKYTYDNMTETANESYFWSKGANSQLWHLKELKNKEMKFELGEDYRQTATENGVTVNTAIYRENMSGTFKQ